MRKTTITILFLLLVQLAQSQYYQKSFGKVSGTDNTDQQEFYDIIDANESLISAGTFRNIDTFPVLAFYGTVSKINKDGNVNWYKGYLPSNFIPYESFLIKSVVLNAEGEIFALGTFLSINSNSAYLLIKLDSDGHVLFSRKIADEYPGFEPKLILNNTNLFAVLGDKIVKFDLEGNAIRAVSSPSITYRDVLFDSDENIVAVGDYINEDPNSPVNTGLPVVRLTQNLDFVNGTVIHSDILGTLYAHCAISYTNDNIIIGGPSSYLSIDSNNALNWARMIPSSFDENTFVVNDYGSFWEFKKANNDKLYFISAGFFSNDDTVVGNSIQPQADEIYFQYYTGIGEIDPVGGDIIHSKDILNGHFDVVDHLELYGIIIDDNMVYGAGRTTDYDIRYHLNYIHSTSLDQLNCGESNRVIVANDVASDIALMPLDGSSFSDQQLIINTISMVEVDIPINYDDQSCNESLGINENQLISIKLIPNPAEDIVTIEGISGINKIVIIDQLGREVKSLTPMANNEFDVSFLSKGVYYVRFMVDSNTYVEKLIKK